MLSNQFRIKKYILISIFALTTPMITYADKNITNDIYYLTNITNNGTGNFYTNGTSTYKTANGSFTQNYKNGTLILGNTTKSAGKGKIYFGSAGYVGYITATFNAKDIYFTGTLGSGNGWKTGGGAKITLNATNNIDVNGASVELNKAGAQNSSLSLSATNNITFTNTTLANYNTGSSGFSITGKKITFNNTKVKLISGGSLTLNSTQGGTIDIASFEANGGSIVNAAKNLDIKVSNPSSYIYVGNLGTFSVSANSFDFAGIITLKGILTAGGNSTLDIRGVKGKTTIGKLDMTTASFRGGNFSIGSLTTHKGASRSVFYDNIGTSTIDNLYIADNGTSNADNDILEFRGGGESLTIGTLKTDKWGILDASKISNLVINTLQANYSTIKAKKLTVKNAAFSADKTYLYTDTFTQKDGKVSLNNGAQLFIKSGTTFDAQTLDMNNGSALYASSKDGMTGATTIKDIIFNNSQIYANSLSTDSITVKNNASVWITSGKAYTNAGDLRIDDGTYLQIHGGDFINNGEINVSLGGDSAKNAKNLINVLDGSFTFNMTMTKQASQNDKGETIQVDVPKAKINVNVAIAGLSAGTTYNLLKTKTGIWFSGENGKIYKNGDSGYDEYIKLLQNRMSFNTTDGSSLALDYFISDDRKSIGFKYETGRHYVNAVPYINPGTWLLGIGSGAAAFGSIGGAAAASGLAKSYTLKLQKQTWHNPITKKDENTVYYMQNLDYHNYGNASAFFTVDARGSDFALGKNQDVGGSEGSVTIGTNTMKSHMVVKADNIYLGGRITLGDSMLISGNLDLQSSGIILGDNKSSVINIRNHSSFKASGTSFKYAGTILLNANATVTDEVGIDLSSITGGIEIGSMEARAARPNSVDPNAGIKMKNFKIGNLKVWNGNGGTVNNYYSSFTSNIGTSSIENLELVKGTSGSDQSGLRFTGGGTSLTIDNARIEDWSHLNADKITDVTINKLFDIPYSTAIFNNLTLGQGLVMNYGGKTDLTINGNFTLNNNAVINIAPAGDTINTILIKGNATFNFDDKHTSTDGQSSPLIKISSIKGLKLNQDYILFKALGTITYVYTKSDGTTMKSTDSKEAAKSLYGEMGDRIALFDSTDTSTRSKAEFDVKVSDKQISFKISEFDNGNPYDANDIRYWLYKRGGMEWVNAVQDISTGDVQVTQKDPNTGKETNTATPDVIAWLNELMINKHNALWAKDLIFQNDLKYFVRTADQLSSTMGQISSVNRKNNSTNLVRLATDVNRTSRLVKLSNTQAKAPTFAEVIRSLQNEHFAISDRNIASVYKFANRNTYKNNLWATVIGAASFVEGGNSILYGINAGYDRFINNQIIGGYIAYAKGKYTGDIIRNDSYNSNLGLYYRAYAGNNEFDISVSGTYGYNEESLYSEDVILQQLNQNYDYNTFTGNLNLNYGYVFGLSNKSIVLKPQIGISAYYICASGNWYCGKKGAIVGSAVGKGDPDLAIDANADNKMDVAVNVALETRQYLNGNSYWYFIAGVSRDVWLKSAGDSEVRFVGNNAVSYKKGDQLNTYASLTAGGELELFRRMYVNLGLGAKAGFAYKDININGSVGMRFVF